MNDQWAIAGGKFTNGFPSVTTHYGYHMTVWHVLLALNGQEADLTDPAKVCCAFRRLALGVLPALLTRQNETLTMP